MAHAEAIRAGNQTATPGRPGLEQILDTHRESLSREMASHLAAEVQSAVDSAVSRERTRAASGLASARAEAATTRTESISEAIRAFRRANSEEEVLSALNERCAAWARATAVYTFATQKGTAVLHCLTNTALESLDATNPELQAVIDERRSAYLPISRLGHLEFGGQSRTEDPAGDEAAQEHELDVYTVPVTTGDSTVALLLAHGAVERLPVDLLCQAASLRLESLTSHGAGSTTTAEPTAWEQLSVEDRRLHLAAQRAARVAVARIRLENSSALERGFAEQDIYKNLEVPLTSARQAFDERFMKQSGTMVDYLHLEVVRSLAAGDEAVLGTGYPGRLV